MGAVSGSALERRSTFLLDSQGAQIASPLLTVTDDALLPRRLGSRPFDDEGVPSRVNTVFERGVFRGFLFDTYTARKTGHESTGNCRRSVGGPAGSERPISHWRLGRSAPTIFSQRSSRDST